MSTVRTYHVLSSNSTASETASLECGGLNKETTLTNCDNTLDEKPEGVWFSIIKPEPAEYIPEIEHVTWQSTSSGTAILSSPSEATLGQIQESTGIPSEVRGEIQRQYNYQVYPRVYQAVPVQTVYARTNAEGLPCQQSDRQEIAAVAGHNMADNGEMRPHLNDNPFHNAEKLYQCEICQLVFTTRGVLTYHMRQRHKKTHKCNICLKEFPQRCNLINHMKSH